MATFLEIGLLHNFSVVFIFLLVFAIVFAVLEYKSPFGKDKKGIHGIIALAISFLIVVYRPAILMINFMTPWFVVLFLFIFMMIFAIMMFGASESDAIALIKDNRVYPYLIVIAVIIVIAAFSSAYGQTLLEKGTNTDETEDDDGNPAVLPGDIETGSTKTTSFGTNVVNTIFHPKVLGLIAIFLIGLFTLTFLTKAA
jgi:hypothetical protein